MSNNRNKCKCGSDNTKLSYGYPCDFGYIACLDCGNTSSMRETRSSIEEAWNSENKRIDTED